MSNPNTLPTHIRQLVDKKNYVIAIKTHAAEQGISMEAAKDQIDAYEAQSQTLAAPTPSAKGLNQLHQSLDNHLQQQHIKVPLIPRWVWRVSVIILVLLVLIWLGYRLFSR